MAYQIYQFNDVALPIYNPAQEHNVSVGSTQVLAIGGVADYYGSRRRVAQITQFGIKGLYAGELYYLVTEGGAHLVDEAGNRLIAHSVDADLRLQLDQLRAVIGTRGTLYRKRWDDNAMQWKAARLLQVRHGKQADDRTVKAELECVFDAPDAKWRGITQASATASGGQIIADNAGSETVDDAILTVTAASGSITGVVVSCAATGASWAWTGTIADGTALVVDCGAATVRKAGVDAYSGFALASGHAARSWLPLEPGLNQLACVITGSGGAALTYYSQFL
jgi:hypothetical protein